MKCIIVGPAFPLRGGIANFNEALAVAFNERGISCSIISFSLQYPSFLFPGKTQLESGNAPENLEIKSLINSINPLSWFKAAAHIRKEKPDFVIVRYWLPFMAPCLGTIARLVRKSCRVIAITDNIIPHEKRVGDSMLTRFFVRSCDAFVAMSKSVLDDLSLFTSNTHKYYSPHPVYNIFGEKAGKEDSRRILNLETGDRYILFFGFVRNYKGLDLLLEAMADEELQTERVKLIVAGEFYEDQASYMSIIKKHQLEDKVILKSDFIPREAVKYYFCASDMVVQPYREATQSGVTQIAYYFERPMLVTRVGGLAEIVPHGMVGYVTDVDAGSIASSIADFYRNNREAAFVANIQTEKHRFSWKGFTDVILNAFLEN
jgi:D-inositol-3-phosphate glycosyltransferase